MSARVLGLGAAAIILFGVGAFVGWKVGQPKMVPVHELPAPAVKQKDGSLVLERVAEVADPKPAQAIPSGGVVERVVMVKVKPRTPKAKDPGAQSPCPAPAPVQVDLSLVRLPDSTRRVVASSPDGEVVGGFDLPRVAEASPQPSPHPNALGLSYSLPSHSYGVFYDRDLGPFRLGVEVRLQKGLSGGPDGLDASLKAGIRF